MSKRRVVVTGLGAVTPIGNNVKDFWAGIRAGKVGIGPITKFDTTDYKVKIAAENEKWSASYESKESTPALVKRDIYGFNLLPVCSNSGKGST